MEKSNKQTSLDKKEEKSFVKESKNRNANRKLTDKKSKNKNKREKKKQQKIRKIEKGKNKQIKSSKRSKKLGREKNYKIKSTNKKNKHSERRTTKEKNSTKKNGKIQKIKDGKKLKKIKSQKRVLTVMSPRQTGCTSDETCLTNIGKFMFILSNKVKNFNQQKSRIEKLAKLSTSKGSKKGDFQSLLANLKDAGGGNASALACSGNTTSPAALKLQALVNNLASCEANIQAACLTSQPTYNTTEVDACDANIKEFEKAVSVCTTGTTDCTCWKAANLETLNTKITPCNLASTNGDFVKNKNSCTQAFSACRSLQDEASQVIRNCAISPVDIQMKLDAAKATQASLEKLQTAATAIANQARAARNIRSIGQRALVCSVYVSTFQSVINSADNSPTASSSNSAANSLATQTVVSCTAPEKSSLKSLLSALAAIILKIIALIKQLQADLEGIYYNL